MSGASLWAEDLLALAEGRRVVFDDQRRRGRSEPIGRCGHFPHPARPELFFRALERFLRAAWPAAARSVGG